MRLKHSQNVRNNSFSHLLKKSKCFSTYKHRYFWQRYERMWNTRLRSLLTGFGLRVLNLKTVNNAHAPVRRTTETQHNRKANRQKQKKKHNNTSGSPSVWPNSILYKVQDILSEWDVCLCSALILEQLLLVLSGRVCG